MPRLHGAPPRRSLSMAGFAGGTVLCVVFAFIVGVLLPISDSANRADAKGTPRSYSDVAVQGRINDRRFNTEQWKLM